jgi:hypothetical protein
MDALWVRRFPVQGQKLMLAFQVEAPTSEGEEHRVKLRVLDPDSTDIANYREFPIRMRCPGVGSPQLYGEVRGLLDLSFAAEGEYTVRIDVDGKEVGGVSFAVLPISQKMK